MLNINKYRVAFYVATLLMLNDLQLCKPYVYNAIDLAISANSSGVNLSF